MLCFKSSINIFVYMLLKSDFRQRVYEMLGCLTVEGAEQQAKERAMDVSTLPSSQPLPKNTAGVPRPKPPLKREFTFEEGSRVFRNSTRAAACAVAARITQTMGSLQKSIGVESGKAKGTVKVSSLDSPTGEKESAAARWRRLSASELGSGT